MAPFRPDTESLIGRMVRTRAIAHVADAAQQQGYINRSNPSLVASVVLGGVRTYLAVPMLKDGEMLGAITVYRQEVRFPSPTNRLQWLRASLRKP